MAEETLRAVVTADISQFSNAMAQMARLVQQTASQTSQVTQTMARSFTQVTTAVQQAGQATQQAFAGQSQQSLQAITQLSRQVSAGFQAIRETTIQAGQAARSALGALEAQTQRLGQTTQRTAQTMTQSLGSATQQTQATGTAFQQLGQAQQQATEHTQRFSGAMTALKGGLAALGIQASIQGLIQIGRSVLTTSAQFESVRASLLGVSGSGVAANATLGLLRVQADRLGVNVLAMAQSFRGMEAAARGTSLQGAEVRKIFISIAEAGRVMGLSSEQLKDTLIAVQQMMNKSKISSEELRGQMAEHLPGSFEIAARAMGVTTAALGDMLKNGELFADVFLPKFARQLQKELGGGVEAASKTAVAAWERFKNAMTGAATNIGDEVVPALTKVLDVLSGILNTITGALDKAKAAQDFQKQVTGMGVKDPGSLTPGTVTAGTRMAGQIRETDQAILLVSERMRTQQGLLQLPGTEKERLQVLREIERSEQQLLRLQQQRLDLEKAQAELVKADIVRARQLALGEGKGGASLSMYERPDSAKMFGRETTELLTSFKRLGQALENIDVQGRNTPGLFEQKNAPKRIPLPLAIEELVEEYALRYGLDPRLMQAVAMQESGGRANIVSPKGAKGIMQLMPATAKRYNVEDPFDPEENIRGGSAYMRDLMQMWESKGPAEQRRLALASYNAGEGRVKEYGGIPPFPETQNYVKRIEQMVGRGSGTSGTADELALIEAKTKLIEKALADINETLAKTPALAGQLPPVLQEELDKYNAQLASLQEQKEAIERKREVETLSAAQAKKDASERARSEEQLRKESLANIMSIGKAQNEALQKQIDLHDAAEEEMRKEGEAAAMALGKARLKIIEQEIEDEQHAEMTKLGFKVEQHKDEAQERERIHKETMRDLFRIEKEAAQEAERMRREYIQMTADAMRDLADGLRSMMDVFQGSERVFSSLINMLGVANNILQRMPNTAASIGQFLDTPLATFRTAPTAQSTQVALDSLAGSLTQSLTPNNFGSVTMAQGVSAPSGDAAAMAALGSGGAQPMQMFASQQAMAGTSPSGTSTLTAMKGLGAIGSGISAGLATNQMLTSVGLSGKSRSAGQVGNTAISGAVGGAVAGNEIVPGGWGAVIGAVVGLIGGLVSGLTSGMADRQKFDIKEQRPARFDFSELAGLRQGTEFLTMGAKTERLDTYTKNFGMQRVSEAAGDLFGNLVGQIRSADPALQKAAAEPLNQYAQTIADLIEGTKFEGRKQLDQIKAFIAGELPEAFNEIIEPLVEGINILQPIIGQFRDAINTMKAGMDALDQQQKEYRDSLQSQSKTLGEASLSDLQLFMKRQQELADLRQRITDAPPDERLNLIPQAQDLVDQVFQMGMSALQDIAGRFQDVMDALQGTMATLAEQQESFHTSLANQAKALEEATFTEAMLFLRKRQELTNLQAAMQAATPQDRIAMIPQAQELINQIFALGSQETVLGQEPEAVRALQGELIGILQQLTGTSDAAFTQAKNDTQAQIDLARNQLNELRANVANTAMIGSVIEQSNAVLDGIQGIVSTGADIGSMSSLMAGLQVSSIEAVNSLAILSDAAFASLRADTQAQIDLAEAQIEYLAANVLNTANLASIADQSLTVLGDIRHFMQTGEVRTTAPPQSPTPLPAPTADPVPVIATPSPTSGPYGPTAPPGGIIDAGGIIHYPDGSSYNTWTGGTMTSGRPDPGFGSFQTGTPYVPHTGYALLHQGEAVIPAALNRAAFARGDSMGSSGGSSVTNHISIEIHAGHMQNPTELALLVAEKVQSQIELRTRFGQSSLRGAAA